MAPAAGADAGVRPAELIASMSLAVDLGLGLPMEHILRQTLIALRLAEEAGLDDDQRAAVYYVSLLAWVGCTADSHEVANWFGDDLQFRADSYDIDMVGVPMLKFLARHLGGGRSPLHRLSLMGQFLVSGQAAMQGSMAAHCEATGQLAERLGLGAGVRIPLQQSFERWDGKGAPGKVREEELAAPIRVVQLADIVEVFERVGGVDAAIDVARARRGTQFDPRLVDVLCRKPNVVLGGLTETHTWAAVIAAEPALTTQMTATDVDSALEAFADYTDLKSPFTLGHSRGVAELANGAASRLALPADEVAAVRRAGLVHDIGVMGIPNSVWDKPGPLSEAEVERARTHSYLAERILARTPALAAIGALAALHHERLDGSGYPKGLAGAALPPTARVLAAADVYHALREPRPHRPAFEAVPAEQVMRREVTAGRLDGEAVNAVLAAAGHRVRRRAELPAGLTSREVEVLCLVARGLSNREVAARLVVSPKTVGSHIEHIYTKLGLSSRAAAALYAMRHGLLLDVELAQ